MLLRYFVRIRQSIEAYRCCDCQRLASQLIHNFYCRLPADDQVSFLSPFLSWSVIVLLFNISSVSPHFRKNKTSSLIVAHQLLLCREAWGRAVIPEEAHPPKRAQDPTSSSVARPNPVGARNSTAPSNAGGARVLECSRVTAKGRPGPPRPSAAQGSTQPADTLSASPPQVRRTMQRARAWGIPSG